MTHEQQRAWLIRQLMAESPEYSGWQVPEDAQQQKKLLRALMNVRMPDPISEDILAVQDEYLAEENRLAGIVGLADLTPLSRDPRLYLWQGDMTTLKVDAIVNAANSQMLGCFVPLHGCIDKATHIRITHPSSCITANC